MDALLKEIEELEKETEGKPFIEEAVEDVVEDVVEAVEPQAEEKPTEESDDDKAKKAQDAYKERQRLKKEDREKQVAESLAAQKAAEDRKALVAKYNEEEAKSARIDEIIMKDRINSWMNSAETELKGLEDEFKIAFTDYDDAVATAMDITIDRMVQGGMTRRNAEEQLRIEKLKIADAAAAKGQDPAEAVYKEAKAINTWFETYAKKLGYEKVNKVGEAKEKAMTTKAALREASKPNAISGGKSASAITTNFDDLEDISGLTIGQMMAGKF